MESVYPIVYLDALFVAVRESGSVSKKAVYTALGVGMDGQREVRGFWIDQNEASRGEGSRFWLHVLMELKNRGVNDIFFVCCDGLTGFPKAIETAFPQAVVQTCIVHMIRASLRYVAHSERKTIAAALKPIYTADTSAAAEQALSAFDERFGKKHPSIVHLWRSRWDEAVPFLSFPRDVRRILYTTNAVESLNFQLRRSLNPRGHFPNEEAVFKVLYLAVRRAQTKWRASPYWKAALAHFGIIFPDRMKH